MKLADLKSKLLADPAVAAEYEKQKPEFEIARALILARKKARLTQAEVAERMGTKQANIARIESGESNVTLATIRKYAAATGQRIKLEIAA